MKKIKVLERNIKLLEKQAKKIEDDIHILNKKLKKQENLILRKDFGHKLKELYSVFEAIENHLHEIALLEHKYKIKPKFKFKRKLRKKK